MRKLYLVAILMLAMVGCDDPMEVSGHIIDFASQINRSIIEDLDGLYGEPGIKLFGTATLNDDIIRLFDAEKLYCSTSSNNWEYDNTRYWVPQAEHHFCALWPYGTQCNFSSNDAVVTIDNYTATATGADLLYATATRNLVDSEDYSAVPLTLHHACAALQFNIINASDKVVSLVNNVYLVGLKNKGTFSFGTEVAAGWVLGDSVVAATDYTTYGGATLTNLSIDINAKNSLYEGGAILVLPQDILSDVKFHLEITKQGNYNPEKKDILLGQLGGSAPTRWETGKRYEYTMTVTENAIVSNVKVIPWVDQYVDL